MVLKQDHTNLKIEFDDNESYNLKLSVRVFRKFQTTVVNYIQKMLKLDPEFAHYYESLLRAFLRTRDVRLVLNVEFIRKAQSIADMFIEQNRSNILPKNIEGVLTEEQMLVLFKTSLTLKLLSPFMYTSLMLEEEREVLFRIVIAPLKKYKIDEFLFEFVRLKFLARANASIWNWLANNRFQDVTYHVVNTFKTILHQILLQIVPGYNPIAYIKSVVEYTIYYLFTDIYIDEVKYTEHEIKKLRYTKSYSLVKKHVLKSAYEQITKVVQAKFGTNRPAGTHLRQYNYKPILQYITLPLMTNRLLKIPYIYFYTLRDLYILNFYTSYIISVLAPNLVTLKQICQCFCTPSKSRYRVSVQGDKIKQLYDLQHPLQQVYTESRVFDEVLKQLLSYEYWHLFTHQEVSVNTQKLAQELSYYYETFILSDKLQLFFDTIRVNNFEIEDMSKSDWRVTI